MSKEKTVLSRILDPLTSFVIASKKILYLLSGRKESAEKELCSGLLMWWIMDSADKGTNFGSPEIPAVVKYATGEGFAESIKLILK